jgi:predicted GNAT superfamily acetyltransferase
MDRQDEPVTPVALAQRASAAASAAAQRAAVIVRILADPADTEQAEELFGGIWATGGADSPVPSHLMRALAYSGNYVAGAWAGGQLVGASVAFLALQDGSVALHSHVTGVVRRLRGSQVGMALKLHQAAWALERGIEEIGWSFDPLIRRNAWFNLTKLRALAIEYRQDFYGRMADQINVGDESDRCLVRWELAAPRVVKLYEGLEADGGDCRGAATMLLDEDSDGFPVVVTLPAWQGESALLCRVPADIEAWRQAQPDRARAWRLGVRKTLGAAMSAGFVASAMTRDGCYVLTRFPGPAEPSPEEHAG